MGELHPDYGPCDAFGPGGRCSACDPSAADTDDTLIKIMSESMIAQMPHPMLCWHALAEFARAAIRGAEAAGYKIVRTRYEDPCD